MKSFLLFLCSLFFISIGVYAGSPDPMVVAVPEGVVLRASPTDSAAKVEKLDVGDRVLVIKTRADAGETWAKVQVDHCVKGNDCGEFEKKTGWVLDKHLANESKFSLMSSWKKSVVNPELGDYSFTLQTYEDGTFKHTFFPGVESGEPDVCPAGYSRNRDKSCSIKGKLYIYQDLVWAKEAAEYFFIKNDQLCSVYSGENGVYCAK